VRVADSEDMLELSSLGDSGPRASGTSRRSDGGFVVRFSPVEIPPPSSRRHGINHEDMQYCIKNALVIEEVSEARVR
jgi:hypothetical protein